MLQKKYISGISKASAFEWYATFVLSPPTPSNEPWSHWNSKIIVTNPGPALHIFLPGRKKINNKMRKTNAA